MIRQGRVEMELFLIISEQMIMLAVYVILGIIGVKCGVLNKDALNHISKFIMKMALPIMIFTSMPEGTEASALIGAMPVSVIIICMYIVIYITSTAIVKIFKVKGDSACVYKAATLFGNVGFIGMPLILAVYPGAGMLYLAIYTIIDQTLLWTFGMYLTTPMEKRKVIGVKKVITMILNPAVIAIMLSLIFVFAGLKLPDVLDTTLNRVGQVTTPLSMIYIGGLFCYFDIRKYLKKAELYFIVICKMLIFPVILAAVLGIFNVATDIKVTLALLAGLPTMTSVAMFANANGSDGNYATAAAFITTVCSMLTLPAVSYVTGIMA